MEYLKIEEIAKKWGLGVRRVQLLCSGGRIEGAVRAFPNNSTIIRICNSYDNWLLPVQSPLLRESLLLSFPPGT